MMIITLLKYSQFRIKFATNTLLSKCNPLQITDYLLKIVISDSGTLKLSYVIILLSLTFRLLFLQNLYRIPVCNLIIHSSIQSVI